MIGCKLFLFTEIQAFNLVRRQSTGLHANHHVKRTGRATIYEHLIEVGIQGKKATMINY